MLSFWWTPEFVSFEPFKGEKYFKTKKKTFENFLKWQRNPWSYPGKLEKVEEKVMKIYGILKSSKEKEPWNKQSFVSFFVSDDAVYKWSSRHIFTKIGQHIQDRRDSWFAQVGITSERGKYIHRLPICYLIHHWVERCCKAWRCKCLSHCSDKDRDGAKTNLMIILYRGNVKPTSPWNSLKHRTITLWWFIDFAIIKQDNVSILITCFRLKLLTKSVISKFPDDNIQVAARVAHKFIII